MKEERERRNRGLFSLTLMIAVALATHSLFFGCVALVVGNVLSRMLWVGE